MYVSPSQIQCLLKINFFASDIFRVNISASHLILYFICFRLEPSTLSFSKKGCWICMVPYTEGQYFHSLLFMINNYIITILQQQNSKQQQTNWHTQFFHCFTLLTESLSTECVYKNQQHIWGAVFSISVKFLTSEQKQQCFLHPDHFFHSHVTLSFWELQGK